ncbi:MAG: NAD(P)/FAD-dependent oxidoreductase [Candidatus Aenigmarchaeota archaeon]|nr:NAD(P)/FAD-dependent oxidoreductase [Candidatus Aenigmarchaeota archaeon]
MKTITKEYDLIVVGAGTAGCACAIHAAKKDLNVAIVERKENKNIGDKVCGDLIDYRMIDWINKYLKLKYPKKGTINKRMNLMETYSPDKRSILKTEFNCAMINRHKFGQALIDDAIKVGCKLYDSSICKEPVIKDNFISGIKIKDAKTGSVSTLRSKIVVDASGAVPALRKKIKLKDSFFESNIDKKDEAFSYREIRKLAKPLKDSETSKIFISSEYADGGYYWYFPEKEDVMNIGIGVGRHLDTSSMKENLLKIVADDPIFKDSKVLHAGGGMLPARKHLDSLVANGFMCAGDSASQINPMSGGGIAQSMMGGYMCANVAADAIKKGNVSEHGLWQLNLLYADRTGREDMGFNNAMFDGGSQAASDLLKIFTQNQSDKNLNFAMKNFIESSMLSKMSMGNASTMPFLKKMKILAKSITNLPLLMKFNRILYLMGKVKSLYNIYPETPDAFPEWKKRLDAIYEETYKVSGLINKV